MTVTNTREPVPSPAPSPTRSRWPVALATAAVGAVAGAIVSRHLGVKPLWLDESVSVSVAGRPVARILTVLTHHDANAGVYDLLLHGWLKFGHGVAWDRGVSTLSFIGTAALATWAVGRRNGVPLGVACGALVVTNPFLVFYGQEARPYALAVLLAVGATTALFARAPRAYVVLTIALLYTELFAVLFAVALAMTLMVVERPLRPMLLRSWRFICLATSPLALWMVLRERSQISWLSRPPLVALGHAYLSLAGGWLALGIVTILAVVAWARSDRVRVTAFAVAFWMPPVALWAVAQLVPTFTDRYVIFSAVGAVGLAVLGLRVCHRVIAVALLGAVVVAGAIHIAALEAAPFKYENPPAVADYIALRTEPGDAIAYGGGGLRTVIDLAVRRGDLLPVDIARAPGGDDIYAREVSPSVLASRLPGIQRMWLVTDPSDHRFPSYGPFASLRSSFAARFRPIVNASFPGIDVTLYAHR